MDWGRCSALLNRGVTMLTLASEEERILSQSKTATCPGRGLGFQSPKEI
jgi:hypothetical protein